jgi:hypothetical protein
MPWPQYSRTTEALGLGGGGAGKVHAAGVAVPAVLDHGDVDVDDVAVLEDVLLARDAVADHAVHRGAQGFRETVVADVGRRRLLHLADVFVAAPVELLGGDAGRHVFGNHLQHLGGQAAGDAHLGDVLVVLEFDDHVYISVIAGPSRRHAPMITGNKKTPGEPGVFRSRREAIRA